jgi:hypothetical protein
VGIRLTKDWHDLADLDPATVPGQLGVFQLGSDDGTVVYIGYAGGNQLFGLRSAVPEAVEAVVSAGLERPSRFRYELTHGYLTRWEELMMLHVHDTGGPPAGNGALDVPKGRLSPGIG